MKYQVLTAACLLYIGCSSSVPPSYLDKPPQLIDATSLPSLPASIGEKGEVTLEVKLYVDTEGKVRDMIWVASSRNREWDSLAATRIMTWKYSPGTVGSKPVAVWVKQSFKVLTVDPENLLLAEIVCIDRVTADSVYARLKKGEDFEALAREFSNSKSSVNGGYMGKVGLSIFPLNIRDQLIRLQIDEYTEPLKLSGDYVIYKRVKSGPVSG